MNKKEIENIAFIKEVSTATIDKDWVLGHFLNSFYSFETNKSNFVFKGGTCLKKCYFEDYRFSEDLDFTLLDRGIEVNTDLISKVIHKIEKISNIKFNLSEIKEQFHNDVPQGYEVKIKFWGADHKPNSPIPLASRWQTHIKLDISFSEQIIEEPDYHKIFHPYSDSHLIREIIPVYTMTEIIAEKLRSLIQRNRPRDIYDIWYVINSNLNPDKKAIKTLLFKKAESKNIEILNVGQFVNEQKFRKNKRAWEVSLKQHLPVNNLPDFDTVYSQLKLITENILKA